FFFSSRRRHTRFSRDWSSDVCSSDLAVAGEGEVGDRADGRLRCAVTQLLAGVDDLLERTLERDPVAVEEGADVVDLGLLGVGHQIGRASCRGRIIVAVVGVSLRVSYT